MSRSPFRILFVALLLFQGGALYWAQGASPETNVNAPEGENWAVVIGIDYQNTPFPQLSYSLNDAQLFCDNFDFKPDHIVNLTSPNPLSQFSPTHDHILKAIQEVSQKTGSNDTFWLYYAGHGIIDQGKSYIVPYDAHLDNLNSFIAVSDLYNRLSDPRNCKAHARLLILDACRSKVSNTRNLGIPTPFDPDFTKAQGTIIFAACKPDESATELRLLKHGVFTYYLLMGLSGAAANAPSTTISLTDLKNYVQQSVSRMTQKQQNPDFIPEDLPDFIVSKRNPLQLKKLQDDLDGGSSRLEARIPLKPGTLVSVTTPDGKEDPYLQTSIQQQLIENGFPVVNSRAAKQLLPWPDDPQKIREAQQAVQRLHVRYLLQVSLETGTPQQDPDPNIGWTASATISLDVVDVDQSITASLVSKPQGGRGNDGQQALVRAKQRAMDDVIPQLLDVLRKADPNPQPGDQTPDH